MSSGWFQLTMSSGWLQLTMSSGLVSPSSCFTSRPSRGSHSTLGGHSRATRGRDAAVVSEIIRLHTNISYSMMESEAHSSSQLPSWQQGTGSGLDLPSNHPGNKSDPSHCIGFSEAILLCHVYMTGWRRRFPHRGLSGRPKSGPLVEQAEGREGADGARRAISNAEAGQIHR